MAVLIALARQHQTSSKYTTILGMQLYYYHQAWLNLQLYYYFQISLEFSLPSRRATRRCNFFFKLY